MPSNKAIQNFPLAHTISKSLLSKNLPKCQNKCPLRLASLIWMPMPSTLDLMDATVRPWSILASFCVPTNLYYRVIGGLK